MLLAFGGDYVRGSDTPDVPLEEYNHSCGSAKSSWTRNRKKKRRTAGAVFLANEESLSSSLKNGLFRPSRPELEAFALLKDMYCRALKFRDHYFEYFPPDRASKRSADVAKVVTKTLQKMTDLTKFFKERNLPWLHAHRALCLSIDAQRSHEAHPELQMAVRYLAHFPPLWLALGESYWDHDDFYVAVSCFEKALTLDRNNVAAMVKLSCSIRLLLRKEGDLTERCKMLLRMLDMAKEAVARSPETGECWYNLGNAYLVYFNVKAQDGLILESLEAFKKAGACPIMKGKAEFNYNHGSANLLRGNYQEALTMWTKAIALEPDWKSPQDELEKLLRYLEFIATLVSGQDRSFRRRVKQLAESVPVKNLSTILTDVDLSHGKLYKVTSVKQLQDGLNSKVIAHGKIYSTSYQTPDPSRLIFLIDSNAEAIPIIIYNMGIEFSIGGSVSIPDPLVCKVDLSHDEKTVCFRYIRVDEPWMIFHNFIRVPRSSCAQTMVSTSAIPLSS